MLGHNSHAVSADQLACGWLIGSSQVEKVISRATRLVFSNHVIILSPADHLATMGDRLYVILVFVARLVQGILGLGLDRDKKNYSLYPPAKTLYLQLLSYSALFLFSHLLPWIFSWWSFSFCKWWSFLFVVDISAHAKNTALCLFITNKSLFCCCQKYKMHNFLCSRDFFLGKSLLSLSM